MRAEIFIGNRQAYVDESTQPKITKRVVDIQQPENRKGDRTLSFTMPGTPVNDELFGSIFEVNLNIQNATTTQFNPDFNPNLKAAFTLIVDTVPQLTGYCQLTEINITNEKKVVYTLVAYGVTADLFAAIGDSLLTDLDFSEYDHEWTPTNVMNSWDTSIIRDGAPLAFQLGRGYVYPMIDYGQSTNPSIWNVKNLFPAIYMKEYVDKIFESAGFSFESDFFDSEYFKRKIMPFSAGALKISDTDIQARLFDVERITSAQNVLPMAYNSFSPDPSTGARLAFNQENSDPSNQWSADILTIDSSGTYLFQAYINLAFRNNTGSTITNLNDVRCSLALVLLRAGVYSVLSDYISPIVDPTTSWTNGTTTSFEDWFIAFPQVQLFATDQIFLSPAFISAEGVLPSGGRISRTWVQGDNVQMVNGIGSYFLNQVGNAQIIPGDTMPMNSTIPVNIKQKDFLLGLIRAFNLYIDPLPNVENGLLVEPRDDYYISDSEDWTYKLDTDKEFKIQPMGLLDAERYLFQYSPDGDYLNNSHQDRYGYTYGRRRVVINNEFVKNDRVIQPIFAATPLAAPQGYADRIVSQIIFVDQNNTTAVKASKPRMLHYAGLLSCSSWILQGSSVSGISQTLLGSYPYAGHLDNPFTPTSDLNFGAPAEIYYGAAFANTGQLQYTENNLYKSYWQSFIEEITDKDSKVVTGYFYLKPTDIYQLSFRKQYFIKDAYYRLLEVSNYDPIANTPCLCTFIKIKVVEQSAPVQQDINGGTGTLGGDDLPVWDLPNPKNGNDGFGPGNTATVGEGNKYGGGILKALVVGDDNLLTGAGLNMVVLGGERNLVSVENVVVINSSDQVVTEPDTTIINDIRYPQRVVIQVASADMLTIGASPIDVIGAPGAGRFIEVTGVKARRETSLTPYSAEDIVLQYTGGINAAEFAQELLTQSGNAIYKATMNPDLVENVGLSLTTQSVANPTTGDGAFIFYIDYIIQNI